MKLFGRYILLPFFAFLLLTSVFVMNGCSQSPKKVVVKKDSLAKEWDKTIQGNFSTQSQTVFDSTKISDFISRYPDFKNYEPDLKNFYSKRKYAYAWFEKDTLIEQAGNLSNRIINLQNEGVYKPAPYQKELDSLLHTPNSDKTKVDINLELMLTAEYFVFSKLAWDGMNASVSKSASWYLPRKKVAYDDYLDSLLKAPVKEASAHEPVYRQYELLRTFLRKYRDLQAQGKWLPITISGKILKAGDSSKAVIAIKKRLFKLEDYHGDTTRQVYNNALVKAVKQFQDRLGLPINGVLNKATLAELNVPLKSRIKQILVNMERSRWLPVSIKTDYLAVNIPEFRLHVYHGDSLLWSCKVVVGKTVHQTTVFYGDVKYVVFSPYWNIPQSIVIKEVLPGMRRDRNYLANHNMEQTGFAGKLPVIRQKPGPKNSLGLVKFLFPNSYNIYLHDTPSKSLFGESARAFSHGCIRVGKPAKLAAFLLQNSAEWTPEKINKAMHQGKEQYVTLKQTVPVFIAYFTAFTDRNNKLNFRKDIYNLDDHLASMILSGKGEY